MLEDKDIIANKQDFSKSILLIDEIDVFFSKDFYGQVYTPGFLYKNEKIIEIIKYIYKNVN